MLDKPSISETVDAAIAEFHRCSDRDIVELRISREMWAQWLAEVPAMADDHSPRYRDIKIIVMDAINA